jgi:hypothetical protein
MAKMEHEKLVLDTMRTFAIFNIVQRAFRIRIISNVIQRLRHLKIPVNHIITTGDPCGVWKRR